MKHILVAAFAFAAAAAPATAQWSATPMVGSMLYDGSLQLRDQGTILRSGMYENGGVPLFGVRLAYELSQDWEAEASYDQSWLSNYEGGLTSHFYRAGIGRVQPLSTKVSGTLGLFGGGVTFRPESAASMSDFIAGVALGMRYRLLEHTWLSSDLRFTGQFCDHPAGKTGLACNDGSQLGYTQVSVGVRFDW